jgi:hypothetical protein
MTRTETSVGKKPKEKGLGRPPNAPARQLRPRGRQLIRMHAKMRRLALTPVFREAFMLIVVDLGW